MTALTTHLEATLGHGQASVRTWVPISTTPDSIVSVVTYASTAAGLVGIARGVQKVIELAGMAKGLFGNADSDDDDGDVAIDFLEQQEEDLLSEKNRVVSLITYALAYNEELEKDVRASLAEAEHDDLVRVILERALREAMDHRIAIANG